MAGRPEGQKARAHLHGHRPAHLPAAARVVQPAHEGPEELDAPGEELAEVGQQDEEHGDAEDGVHDGDGASGRGGGRDVSVPCSTEGSTWSGSRILRAVGSQKAALCLHEDSGYSFLSEA
jgi:hypothetical protein